MLPEDASVEYDGAVVLMDALGVKGIWHHERDPKAFAENWARIMTSAVRRIGARSSNSRRSHQTREPRDPAKVWECMEFSDSLIVTAPTQDIDAAFFDKLQRRICRFLWALLDKDSPLPLYRGAIATGRFYRCGQIIIGPAVDEAAEWCNLAEWAGLMLTPSAVKDLESSLLETRGERRATLKRMFPEWKIPLKAGVYEGGRALAWPIPNIEEQVGSNISKVFSNKQKIIDAFHRSPVQVDVAKKYLNTIAFHNKVYKDALKEIRDKGRRAVYCGSM